MTLLIVRTAIRSRRAAAAMVGAVAVVDLLYAGLGAAGAAPLVQVEPIRLVLGLIGGGVVVAIGARTLWSAWRYRAGLEVPLEVATPRRAFLTGAAATASNPLTVASWASIFAAASVASATPDAVALVLGMGVGGLMWGLALAAGSGILLRRLGSVGHRCLTSGTGLVGFAGLLGVQAVADA